MSSVLHPVGPEEPQTYWGRRAAILVVVAVLAGLLIWLLLGSGADRQAAPANSPPSPTALNPGGSSASSPSMNSAIPSSSAPATATASATPAGSVSPSAARSTSASTSTTARPSPTQPRSAKPAPVACTPAKLRTTLTGVKKITADDKLTFDLSVINGTGSTCQLVVDQDRFELKVYSGTDRIWSSTDCTSEVRPQSMILKPEQAIEWTMRWNTERSGKKCTVKPGALSPGVYVATAAYHGAEPVQLVMNLR